MSRRVTSDCKIVAIFTTLSGVFIAKLWVPGEYAEDNKLSIVNLFIFFTAVACTKQSLGPLNLELLLRKLTEQLKNS